MAQQRAEICMGCDWCCAQVQGLSGVGGGDLKCAGGAGRVSIENDVRLGRNEVSPGSESGSYLLDVRASI